MRHRLTDTTIRKLPAPETGNKVYFDTLLAGFGLRVTANDARSFVLDYRARADRRQRRFTIGNIETWSAATARERARKLKREVDAGNDPLGELEQERAAPTINELADRYVAEHLPRKRPRSRIEDERLLPIIRAALGREKVAAVTYTHIDRLHRTVTDERGPFRANRVLALLSARCSPSPSSGACGPTTLSLASSATLSRSASASCPSPSSSACSMPWSPRKTPRPPTSSGCCC